jgi:hypothetical protein
VLFHGCSTKFFVEEAILENGKFNVTVSCIEIYLDAIHDLLTAETKVPQNSLKINEKDGIITVPDLSEFNVQDALSAMTLLDKGLSKRVVGETDMNRHSSRSHAIFTINLEKIDDMPCQSMVFQHLPRPQPKPSPSFILLIWLDRSVGHKQTL